RFILHTACVLLSISAAHAQNPEYIRNLVPSTAKAHASLASVAKVFSPVSITNAPRSWPKPLSSSTPWTAAGTEFYACFPSVVGSSDGDPATKIRSLFISSRAPARVTIEMLKGAFDTTFIVTPGQFGRVDIPIYDALNRDDFEVAESKVIHIFSKEIITVYGLSHNYQSSDGFVIYPTQVLGTSYLVMSARNSVNYDLYGEIQTDTIKAPDTTLPNPRSEFAIVATQNNTNVTFTLTATSYSGRLLADSTYTIRLDRGQVYQVMARDTGTHLTSNPPNSTIDWWRLYAPWTGGPDCDLTGSYITSDKPIAVFSGHERAASPSAREYDPISPNRDHLVEQMLPTSAWGKNYIIAGSGQDNAMGRPAGGDVIRILSGFNNTHVTVNGTPMFTLAQGEYRDVLSGTTAVIASDLPVLVAHIMQSSGTDNIGDPDLTLARPIEDYANEYTLPPWNDFPAFTEPHLLVICDTSVTKTTLYNGVPFPSGYWNPIPGTSFSSGIFPVHYNLAQ
ncbi:MAG TPA: IgGFc-binding protein, partial [Candidatus Kapabacteria bacterium]|nr:IgGFc-binding protein [Candidatus Kapabacteria bacterium]